MNKPKKREYADSVDLEKVREELERHMPPESAEVVLAAVRNRLPVIVGGPYYLTGKSFLKDNLLDLGVEAYEQYELEDGYFSMEDIRARNGAYAMAYLCERLAFSVTERSETLKYQNRPSSWYE